MPVVSIILPLYNGENYIEGTLKSILCQKFHDFELIIIDDGSSDNSYSICKKYQAIDNRIKILQQDNQGISAARNAGLRVASGDYIAFSDQDDYMSDQWLEIMVSEQKRSNADIVRTGYKIINVDSQGDVIRTRISVYKSNISTQSELRDDFSKYRDCFQSIWNCLYKKELLDKSNAMFQEEMKYGGEDITFNIILFPFINIADIVEDITYYHYKREKVSTSSKLNSNRVESIIRLNEVEGNIIDAVYKNNVSVNKWKDSETVANVCLIVTVISENKTAATRYKLRILADARKKLVNKYSIKEYYKNFSGIYGKRCMAGILFKINALHALLLFGRLRVERNK